MTDTRTTSPAELLVTLRRDDSAPLHGQLERALRDAIHDGRLAPGTPLPATRTLAGQLDISRGVVVEAYEQLVAEGYLASRHGGGTWVASRGAGEADAPVAEPVGSPPRFDFSYGRPDVTEFPRPAWLRSLRHVLNEAPSERLGYLDGRGAPELRDALAAYLNRVRGTRAVPGRIVVTNGFAQALDISVAVLRAGGARRVAAEDPGQNDTPQVVARHGLDAVAVPVDEEGIVVEALERTGADVVVVTPAHHFPTGVVMSAERRARLATWARSGDRIVIEDDYDAEYRYDREPIGAIQGLAPEHVLYAGSASKTLAPGLRLGWLVCPARLIEQLASAKETSDRGSAGIEQLAFADFLARGEFDRHLRRMRPIYRRRRDVLLAALRESAPDLRPTGASAGLHVTAWLPDGIDEAALVARCADLGVRIGGIGRYRMPPGDGPAGLVFGYGSIGEGEIRAGVGLVGRALSGAVDGPAPAAAKTRRQAEGAGA